MCGIAGIVHFERSRPIDPDKLRRMTETLQHRGPDGFGFMVKDNVGLGHRRLSIIDLSTGDQPQYSDDGSLAIVFNGEIYNYVELRRELMLSGHLFRTNSDTEVILKAYQHWGVDCQNHFNGMWAFALWDEREKRLFISRDRLGEKPLYYAVADNSLIFGSEIKALLAYGISPGINQEFTEIYLSLGYVPAPFSFYKGISKLKQGHYILVTDSVHLKKYWDIPMVPEKDMLRNPSTVASRFGELLTDSVRIRMRSDVPFGAFLSGGLDSASIVAEMAMLSKFPVKTFTIGFNNRSFDERALASEVAGRFQTEHTEEIVEPGGFDASLERIIKHFDEPFGDSSAIPTGYVCQVASKKVKMVLTGDGGDEVLSGYNSYAIERLAADFGRVTWLTQGLVRSVIRPLKGIGGDQWRYRLNRLDGILAYLGLPFESRLIIKSTWSTPSQVRRITSALPNQVSLKEFIDQFFVDYPYQDPFYRLMGFHFKVQLADDFLTKVDRMSMASSIETRVPFLDHRLVEFMMGVSKDVKMPRYQRKAILRRGVAKKLPRNVRKASKKGFTVPLREWFKDDKFDGILKSIANHENGLNPAAVREVIELHRSGKQDLGNFLWILVIYDSWIQGRTKKSSHFSE